MASLKKRGATYYAQYYVGDKQVRRRLHTASLQVAKEKLRKLESSLYRGEVIAGPTKIPTVPSLTCKPKVLGEPDPKNLPVSRTFTGIAYHRWWDTQTRAESCRKETVNGWDNECT